MKGVMSHSFRARQKFRKRIGFGQIVVAAGPQPFDSVIDLAERRENRELFHLVG